MLQYSRLVRFSKLALGLLGICSFDPAAVFEAQIQFWAAHLWLALSIWEDTCTRERSPVPYFHSGNIY